MRSVGTARRRAEEFASLLEDPSSASAASADRHAALLELVGALRDTPAPTARPEFVTGLRERLLAEADTALAPDRATTGARAEEDVRDRLRLPARSRRHERRLAAVVGGLALVGTTASVAAAAQGSLPGDTLYPIKRAIEEAHTGISLDSSDKAATLLSSARARLGEVEALTGDGSPDASAVAGTLGTFAEQATQGSDLLLSEYRDSGDRGSVTTIHDFAAESLGRITALEPSVPDEARDELVHAAQVVVQLDATAQQACPSCGGPAIGEIPPIFVASATRPPTAVTDPAAPGTAPTPSGTHGSRHHRGHHADQPSLPEVGTDELAPGSTGASTSPALPTPSTSTAPQGPLGTLTDTLTGALLGGDDTTGDKTAKTGKNGGTKDGGSKDGGGLGGLGDTVDGLGDTVDGLLGGVTGSLLDGQDRTGPQ